MRRDPHSYIAAAAATTAPSPLYQLQLLPIIKTPALAGPVGPAAAAGGRTKTERKEREKRDRAKRVGNAS